jgi:hypothetical protein
MKGNLDGWVKLLLKKSKKSQGTPWIFIVVNAGLLEEKILI